MKARNATLSLACASCWMQGVRCSRVALECRKRTEPTSGFQSDQGHRTPALRPLCHLKITEVSMMKCEVCGNDYDKAFTVTQEGTEHIFDSFECAIHALAPRCDHCQCMIIGHGVESDGVMYCCAHCAKCSGVAGARDRV